MRLPIKAIALAVTLVLGGAALPAAAGADTLYGGGIVAVRDHGHGHGRYDRRDFRRGGFYGSGVSRYYNRRDFRRARHFDDRRGFGRHGGRYHDHRYYGHDRGYYRDYRRHGGGGIVIRLR